MIYIHPFHGNIWTHNWPAPNVSGFIAQLVRASHPYREVTGSNRVEVLQSVFFRLLYTQFHKLRSLLRGSSFTSLVSLLCSEITPLRSRSLKVLSFQELRRKHQLLPYAYHSSSLQTQNLDVLHVHIQRTKVFNHVCYLHPHTHKRNIKLFKQTNKTNYGGW